MASSPAEEARTITRLQTGHTSPIHHSQLDYYGKILATCSWDGRVHLYDVSNPLKTQLKVELSAHEGPVWAVAWAHPRFNGIFASCSHDKSIIIWKEDTSERGQNAFTVAYKDSSHRASVNDVKFLQDHKVGLILAAGSSDGSISLLSYS